MNPHSRERLGAGVGGWSLEALRQIFDGELAVFA